VSKQIYVQAQADHIASMSKAAPLSALEELVWNALDADAREVKVDLITNALGAVEAVRVADDGLGIDVLRADATFGSLGGSWKRGATQTENAHRRLHGRHGRGRFKAFALGSRVEWRTTTRAGGDLLSYVLWGEIDRPGVFELETAPTTGPATGTEVFISNVRATCDSLLNATETVQALAAKFALYLKSYPDVRIYFNGLPVTPVIVQKKVTDYKLTLGGGAEAKLEIIEWKRKFTGSGRLVLAGPDGFQLHEQTAGVRSGGASFTAYLVSPRFPALHAENALVMDELNPEVRLYLDEAKKTMKAHFIALGGERAAGRVDAWSAEGSYPFDLSDASKERERFDKLAAELVEKMESFAEMPAADRGVVFQLLKRAMASVPRGGLKEFLK
jgi:hypothetical protein